MTARNRQHLALGLLLLAGAVVRVLFFLELKDTDLARIPLLDSQTYHEWAARLVGGDWGWNETYWMGPLYPHLLAVVYALFGVGSQVALVLQLAMSLLNVWLCHRLALRMTGSAEGALLAAGIFSLYGAPVFYAGTLLMATLVTTLYLLVGLQSVNAVQQPTTGNWLKLGLLVGLTGLARGNVLLLLAFLPVLLWKATHLPAKDRHRRTAVLVAAGLLVLLPVTVRNLLVADDFVLLTSNGGVNLLIGQQADYKGIFAPVMDEPQAEFDPSMETTLERELGRDLKGSEVSRILTRRAWDEFRANLGAMPMHYLRKIYRFWNGYELPQIVSYDHWRTQFPALRPLILPFTLLSALGLLGLYFMAPRQRWIMLILVGVYFLSLLPFFPTSRYRQPLAPLLAISSAAYLLAMWRAHAARRRLWLPVAVLAIVALLPRWAALDAAEVTWQVHLHEASRASKRGDLKTTLAKGRQAEEARPGLADTPFHLSLYLEDLGARQEALAALSLARTRAPENRLVPYKIGRNFEEMGRHPEAEAAYLQAVELDPNWAYPWLRLGLVYRQMGQPEQALQALVRAHQLGGGNQRVRANLAAALAEAGRPDEARQLLGQLTADYPHYVNGWFNLAVLELQQGNFTAARTALDRAAALPRLSQAEQGQIRQLAAALEQARQR